MTNVILNDKKDYTNPSYRRSDHPSFKDSRHTMVVDSQGASNRDVKTESGTLRFENGVAVLPDDSRARDIVQEMNATEARHPNQYALLEDRPTVNVDETHRYHFGWSRRYERAHERLFGKLAADPDQEDENVETDQPVAGGGRGPNQQGNVRPRPE